MAKTRDFNQVRFLFLFGGTDSLQTVVRRNNHLFDLVLASLSAKKKFL